MGQTYTFPCVSGLIYTFQSLQSWFCASCIHYSACFLHWQASSLTTGLCLENNLTVIVQQSEVHVSGHRRRQKLIFLSMVKLFALGTDAGLPYRAEV